MKFLIFGTGEYYNRYKSWFKNEQIQALIDNAKEKQGHFIDGIPVIPPENISQYEFDAVVILSFYVRAMRRQLISLGIAEKKIYHFFDLHDLIYTPSIKKPVKYYGSAQGENMILLLSQDLTLGGPALALYHAAQVLVRRKCNVVYGSMTDGPLRETLMKEDIPVIVDQNLMVSTMRETDWISDYSLVICNTMNYHVFLSDRDMRIPVVWWLHDALFFYDGANRKALERLSAEHMKIWSVGPIPKRAIKTYRSDLHVQNLLYGVPDQTDMVGKPNKPDLINISDKPNKVGIGIKPEQVDKVRFTVIGYIEYRKGQDILLEAIRNLESDVRQKAEFLFVGQNTSVMAGEVMERAAEIPEITVTGPVDRKTINCILEETDLLVCPSREDPMPTVAAEAMMHGVPCLISDAAGTAQYIKNGIDGFVFKSEDADQLKALLEKCILDRPVWMGRNARRIFENYFSMEAFETRFISLLKEMG